jgi:hypothetical protein
VADMLTYLNDKLMPRDLTRMERDGFVELVRLIGKGGKRYRQCQSVEEKQGGLENQRRMGMAGFFVYPAPLLRSSLLILPN